MPVRVTYRFVMSIAGLVLGLAAMASAQLRSAAPMPAVVASPAFADQQPFATPVPFEDAALQVEGQLNSTNVRTIAWVAYNAGAYQVEGAIPARQHLLESALPASVSERWAFRDVVLDALVQLNARLPAGLLAETVRDRPVQSLVLLANAIDAEPVLLNLLDLTSGFRWFAAADLLLQRRTPGLAAHLLTTLKLHLVMTVFDPGRSFGRGSGAGPGIGCGVGQNPAGFPPHAHYRFEEAPRIGLVVLATGPQAVYYLRTVTTTFQYGTSEIGLAGPSDDHRMAYMEAMRLTPHDAPLRATTMASIEWSTPAALVQRIAELRRDIERRQQALINDLVRTYNLAPDGRTPVPPIDVRLVDERMDRAVSLPTIR